MTENECIRAYNHLTHIWDVARVIQHAGTPRSYVIETKHGSKYRRKRKHLRKTGETFPTFQKENELDI